MRQEKKNPIGQRSGSNESEYSSENGQLSCSQDTNTEAKIQEAATTQAEKLRRIHRDNAGLVLFDDAIPDEFYRPKLEYFQTLTDAPREFLFTGLLMMTATIVGNRVFYSGPQILKPNLYTVLLAGSTINRKGTAGSYAKKHLSLLERRIAQDGVSDAFDITSFRPLDDDTWSGEISFLMPQSGSLEGLIEAMREPGSVIRYEGKGKNQQRIEEPEIKTVHNTGLAYYGEFDSFLSNIKKDYNKGYEGFILDVYDGQDHKRQLKNESAVVKNPCLSILGASTLAQFRQQITEKEKHSGFLQRFLFAYAPDRQGRPLSMIQVKKPDDRKEQHITDELYNLFKTAETMKATGGEFVLSEEAATIYQQSFDYDMEYIESIEREDPEFAGLLRGYHGRLDAKKFKIAMVYEVVKQSQMGEAERVISGESMRQAVETIRYYWASVRHLLKHEFKFNRHEQKVKGVLDSLKARGGTMSKRDLQNGRKWPPQEFATVIQTGIDAGLWTEEEEITTSRQTRKVIRLIP